MATTAIAATIALRGMIIPGSPLRTIAVAQNIDPASMTREG
jgi:hypothetical protein